jgi:hypothetical protein
MIGAWRCAACPAQPRNLRIATNPPVDILPPEARGGWTRVIRKDIEHV